MDDDNDIISRLNNSNLYNPLGHYHYNNDTISSSLFIPLSDLSLYILNGSIKQRLNVIYYITRLIISNNPSYNSDSLLDLIISCLCNTPKPVVHAAITCISLLLRLSLVSPSSNSSFHSTSFPSCISNLVNLFLMPKLIPILLDLYESQPLSSNMNPSPSSNSSNIDNSLSKILHLNLVQFLSLSGGSNEKFYPVIKESLQKRQKLVEDFEREREREKSKERERESDSISPPLLESDRIGTGTGITNSNLNSNETIINEDDEDLMTVFHSPHPSNLYLNHPTLPFSSSPSSSSLIVSIDDLDAIIRERIPISKAIDLVLFHLYNLNPNRLKMNFSKGIITRNVAISPFSFNPSSFNNNNNNFNSSGDITVNSNIIQDPRLLSLSKRSIPSSFVSNLDFNKEIEINNQMEFNKEIQNSNIQNIQNETDIISRNKKIKIQQGKEEKLVISKSLDQSHSNIPLKPFDIVNLVKSHFDIDSNSNSTLNSNLINTDQSSHNHENSHENNHNHENLSQITMLYEGLLASISWCNKFGWYSEWCQLSSKLAIIIPELYELLLDYSLEAKDVYLLSFYFRLLWIGNQRIREKESKSTSHEFNESKESFSINNPLTSNESKLITSNNPAILTSNNPSIKDGSIIEKENLTLLLDRLFNDIGNWELWNRLLAIGIPQIQDIEDIGPYLEELWNVHRWEQALNLLEILVHYRMGMREKLVEGYLLLWVQALNSSFNEISSDSVIDNDSNDSNIPSNIINTSNISNTSNIINTNTALVNTNTNINTTISNSNNKSIGQKLACQSSLNIYNVTKDILIRAIDDDPIGMMDMALTLLTIDGSILIYIIDYMDNLSKETSIASNINTNINIPSGNTNINIPSNINTSNININNDNEISREKLQEKNKISHLIDQKGLSKVIMDMPFSERLFKILMDIDEMDILLFASLFDNIRNGDVRLLLVILKNIEMANGLNSNSNIQNSNLLTSNIMTRMNIAINVDNSMNSSGNNNNSNNNGLRGGLNGINSRNLIWNLIPMIIRIEEEDKLLHAIKIVCDKTGNPVGLFVMLHRHDEMEDIVMKFNLIPLGGNSAISDIDSNNVTGIDTATNIATNSVISNTATNSNTLNIGLDTEIKDKSREGMSLLKQVMMGIKCCFTLRNYYSSNVLALGLEQLSDIPPPLPTLLMRTIIQTITLYPQLVLFVATRIIPKLISKRIWEWKIMWDGIKRLLKIIEKRDGGMEIVLGIIGQMPDEQARELLMLPSFENELKRLCREKEREGREMGDGNENDNPVTRTTINNNTLIRLLKLL